MSRAIPPILAAMLLGVASTLALAWGAVLARSRNIETLESSGATTPDAQTSLWWLQQTGRTMATDALLANERVGSLMTVTLIGGSERDAYAIDADDPATITMHNDPQRRPPWVRLLRIEAGWPYRCLVGERWERGIDRLDLWPFQLEEIPEAVAVPDDVTLDGAVVLEMTTDGAPQDVLIPVRPVWDALLLNALILTLPAILLVGSIQSARGAIRRRRGRCPKCGYRLGGRTGCPECGWGRGRG